MLSQSIKLVKFKGGLGRPLHQSNTSRRLLFNRSVLEVPLNNQVFLAPGVQFFSTNATIFSESNASLIELDETPDPVKPLIHTYQGHQISQFNRNLEKVRTLTDAYNLCRSIKENSLQPDLHTYNLLLKAIKPTQDFNQGLVYLRDMVSLNIMPDISTINLLMELGSRNTVYVKYIISLAESLEINLNATSREIILQGLHKCGDYTQLFDTWENWRRDIIISRSLTLPSFQILVRAYAELGMTESALNLLQDKCNRAINSPTPIWLLEILRLFSDNHKADASYYLLNRILESKIYPDEGACESLLVTAAYSGHSKLAGLVVKVLGSLKVELTEWHFLPLVQTFLKSSEENWEKALYILDIMRDASIPIAPRTFFPPVLAHLLKNHTQAFRLESYLKTIRCSHDTLWNLLFTFYVKNDQIDQAAELYEFIKTGSEIPISSLLTLSIDTFDTLLEGAANKGLQEFGSKLLLDIEALNLEWSVTTYCSLVSLAVKSPTDYEAAFQLLEKMKSEGHTPPVSIYKSIIRRCATERDPRVYLAMDEMRAFGYAVSTGLRRFVETGGSILVIPSRLSVLEQIREAF